MDGHTRAKLCDASAVAKGNCPDIIGLLHGAYHGAHSASPAILRSNVREARQCCEQLLVAIIAAEQAMDAEKVPA